MCVCAFSRPFTWYNVTLSLSCNSPWINNSCPGNYRPQFFGALASFVSTKTLFSFFNYYFFSFNIGDVITLQGNSSIKTTRKKKLIFFTQNTNLNKPNIIILNAEFKSIFGFSISGRKFFFYYQMLVTIQLSSSS